MSNSVKSNVLDALPPRVHNALKVVKIATQRGELPLHARIKLLMQAPSLFAHLQRSKDFRLVLPGGPVYLGRNSFYIDALVLDGLWNVHFFGAACQDRVVLDLGAHKGYFGVWALKHGASFVISCEPQSDNFTLLEKARAENDRSDDWEVMRIAVGANPGEVSLFVSPESWAHSIYEQMVDSVSVERVPMVTLATVLERASEERPGQPVVMKVNVEGSAGPILMAATAATLAPVVEIHLDYEPGSPYEIAELLRHLAAAGLDEVRQHHDKLWVISRAGSDHCG
jgi:FkbM family methyltransferase